MRRFISAITMGAIVGIASGSLASAADMPVKAPARPAAYNWAGYYAGFDAGAGWGMHDRSLVPGGYQYSYKSRGFMGGLHGGYNWQRNELVYGLEADLKFAGIKGDDGSQGGTLDQTKAKWLGSVRGRFGHAWNRTLLFVTGGWAFANLEHYTDGGTGETFSATKSGFTLGAGIEYAFNAKWRIRAEYRYYDLGTYQNLTPKFGLFPFEVKNMLNTATVGVSYRF